MSLLTPWFLLGGLAVGIPVWVHLIRKQQSTPSPLPSLMFFRRLPVRTMSRQHLEHLLLLAARCLLILLLALAFARPFFTGNNPIAAAAKARLVVVMVDVSASMRYGDRAAKAEAAARDAIKKLGALDQAQMLTFAAEAHILGAASTDHAALLALAASELKPTALPTRYAAAFSALEKIARTSTLPVTGILITDSQKTGWTAGSEPPRLPNGGTVEWVSIDDQPHPNWAVADVRINHYTFQSKYPRGVQARVNGFGTKEAAKRDVAFLLNGREIQRRKVEVPSNGSVAVTFDGFDLPPGVSRGEIKMTPGDDLPLDDNVYFTIERREPYKILFVGGGAGSERTLLYFRHAASSGDDPAFVVESQGTSNLSPYGAVVLFNTSSAPASLRGYVEKGGGLLILPGDRTDWRGLESALGPLMPAGDGEKVYVRRENEQFITIGDFQRDHLLFEPFQGPAAAGLQTARFFGYFRVKAADGVLARFSSGDPALVEKTVGKGRVLLLTSAPDNIWSDLPVRPGFVPLVKQAARYLTRLPDEPAYFTVPAMALVAESAEGVKPQVMKPGGKRLDEELKSGPAFVKLDETGFYELRRQGTSAYIAANSDPRESDLTPMPAEDRALLMAKPSDAAAAAVQAGQDAKPTREEQEARQNMWWTVLVIVALLAALESFAGNGILKLPREEEP